MLYNSPITKKIECFQSFLCRNENPLFKETQTQLVQREKNPKAKKTSKQGQNEKAKDKTRMKKHYVFVRY
jgi:hypothetical protein